LLAQTQFRMGAFGEAADLVHRGLVVAPNDPQLLVLRAELELARGERKQAAATLAAVVATRPGDANALVRLAEVKVGLGERQGAAALLEQAAATSKHDPALQGRIVAVALRMGNVALARKLAEQGVAAWPDDPQARLILAATQSAQNDAVGAWATTLGVLDQKPATPMALTALSAMARTPHERRELLARYARAIDAKTTSPQVYLEYAGLLRAEPAAKETPLTVLEKGLNALPDSVALREALIEEYLRDGKADKALSTAQSGAAISNAPAAAHALLAATYERVGKTELATEAYRRLSADYPQRPDWRLKLAQLEAAGNRPTEAATVLRALITERPFDASGYLALAGLTAKDNPTEAISVARQMGQRDELKGAAMLLEGDILAESGKTDNALEQFNKAAKAGVLPAAMLRIVRLLDQTSHGPAADREMAEALRRYPDDATVLGFASQRELAAGSAGKAVELLERLATKTPNNPFVLNDLAWAQIQAGRPEALANARKAAIALPNNAIVLDTLGVALAKAGKREEAIANLRAAANLAPLAAMPRLHLSEQLLAAGDRAGASAALRSVSPTQLSAKDQATLEKLKSALSSS
jgi:cellulose synthase operon protein C